MACDDKRCRYRTLIALENPLQHFLSKNPAHEETGLCSWKQSLVLERQFIRRVSRVILQG